MVGPGGGAEAWWEGVAVLAALKAWCERAALAALGLCVLAVR